MRQIKLVTLSDGSTLEVGLTGKPASPVIMLPIAKKSVTGQEAESLKMWGVDPDIGKHFVEGLSDLFQVLHFDYEGHRFQDVVSPEEYDWDQVQVTLNPAQTKQFLTLYQSLSDFDDTSVHGDLSLPKLTFAGEADRIVYGENFGRVTVDIAGALRKNEPTLRQFGWDVVILPGNTMDHTKAMQPETVLPVIKP